MSQFRSWLFVPGDSEKKIQKALTLNADVIILDLEDAVLPNARTEARLIVSSVVKQQTSICVRINPWQTDDAKQDLAALAYNLPAIIMQPKVMGAKDLFDLDAYLSDSENKAGRATGSTKVIALVTETAAMTAALPTLDTIPERVIGLTWGGEDLSAELGATTNKNERGEWLPTFEFARTQTLLAAKRHGVLAIDTLCSDFRSTEIMTTHNEAAVRDGFDGVLAIHPAQVPIIHDVYHPSDSMLAHAEAVLAAFEKAPTAGAVQLNGQMLDRPHLKQARKILARRS